MKIPRQLTCQDIAKQVINKFYEKLMRNKKGCVIIVFNSRPSKENMMMMTTHMEQDFIVPLLRGLADGLIEQDMWNLKKIKNENSRDVDS